MKNNAAKALTKLLSIWQQSLLAFLSGILLSLAFLDANYYFCAWFAFVPFLMAINGASLLRSYCLGLMSGLAFCISAGYWVLDFIMLSKGYSFGISLLWSLVFWFYCAQLSALIALSFCCLKQRNRVHEFILFPLIIVTFYSAFPMLFTVRLGESQSHFLAAIQAIEFTGVHGLDAIIALSNIMLFRLAALLTASSSKASKWPWLISVALIFSWFTYGLYATQYWHLALENAKSIRLGIVQPNEVPSLEESKPYPGFSRAYPPEMAMTERLSEAGAEIVIWPEAKYKAYLDQPYVSRAYQHQLKALNSSLVFQDIEHRQSSEKASSDLHYSSQLQYNTALMLNEKGEVLGQYQKMKRIAFGEYVPLVSDIPVMRAWVEGFFGKFLNEMAPGTTHEFFEAKTLNIIPLICYELMFPEFVAAAVAQAQSKGKTSGLLVGLSSNGWFGATRQPYQHVNASILRAVENRMPLVHAVNNGPSIVALPTGRVIFISDYHQAGGYIVDVPYSESSQGSYFSQHPKLFLFSVYGILVLTSVLSLRRVRLLKVHST